MYYVLKPELELCGYRGLPFALYDRPRNKTYFYNRKLFEVALSCDGRHDVNPDAWDEEQKQFFHILLTGELIEETDGTKTIAPRQEYRLFDNYVKEEAQWSVTGDCNYRCRHCFMSAPDAKFGVPTLEQLLSLVPQMEACGVRRVGLTGGEPLIRSDLFTVVDALTEHGIRIDTIYSNGALVTEKLLDELTKRNLRPGFQLSYDGVNGMHDWLRGIEGAEKAVFRAMDLLRERGFYFSAALTLHKRNIQDLRQTIRVLADHGCQALKLGAAYSLGCWTNNAEDDLSYEAYAQALLDYIPAYLEDGMPLNLMMEGYFEYNRRENIATVPFADETDDKSYMCNAMKRSMYIAPDGKVLPCMSVIGTPIGETFPNVFETPLHDILNDSVYTRASRCKVKEFMDHNPQCAACAYRVKCGGGCRAMAVSKGSMDFLCPEEITCRFFLEGWYDRFKAATDSFNESLKKQKEKDEAVAKYLEDPEI